MAGPWLKRFIGWWDPQTGKQAVGVSLWNYIMP